MTPDQIREWLDEECQIYPERTPYEEFAAYQIHRTTRLAEHNRAALVEALSGWIYPPNELRAMLAVDIAEAHGLIELRSQIERLIEDVRKGGAFLPHCESMLQRVLDDLAERAKATRVDGT